MQTDVNRRWLALETVFKATTPASVTSAFMSSNIKIEGSIRYVATVSRPHIRAMSEKIQKICGSYNFQSLIILQV